MYISFMLFMIWLTALTFAFVVWGHWGVVIVAAIGVMLTAPFWR